MNKIKKLISLLMICFLLVTFVPVNALGTEQTVADIKWTFQSGAAPGEGYSTDYAIECSTDYAYSNNMALYAPGGGYQSPQNIWAVYDVPVTVAGTYKFYMYFGSSAMNSTDMDFKPAYFTATVGGEWDSVTDTYTGGEVAFENREVVGGGWGTLGNQHERCKEVPIGYITLFEGVNTIKLDIMPTFHFRIASKTFRLEYIAPSEYEGMASDGNTLDLTAVPEGVDNIAVKFTNDVYTDDAVYSLKQGETPLAVTLKPSDNKKEVLLSLRESLTAGKDYTLSVSGLGSEIGSVGEITKTFSVVKCESGNSSSQLEITESNIEGTLITVSGSVKNSLGDTIKGREVKFLIKKPGENDFSETEISDVSDENGKVCMSYEISAPALSGPYQLKLSEQYGGQDIAAEYYIDKSFAEKIFSKISLAKSGEEVKGILEENIDILGFDLSRITTAFGDNEKLFYNRFAGNEYVDMVEFGNAWEINFILEKLNQEESASGTEILLEDIETRKTLGIDKNNYHENFGDMENDFWSEIAAMESQKDIEMFLENYNNISVKYVLIGNGYTTPTLSNIALSGYAGQLLEEEISLEDEVKNLKSYSITFVCESEESANAFSVTAPKRVNTEVVVSGKSVTVKFDNLKDEAYKKLGVMAYSTSAVEESEAIMFADLDFVIDGFEDVLSYKTEDSTVSIATTENKSESRPSYSTSSGGSSRPSMGGTSAPVIIDKPQEDDKKPTTDKAEETDISDANEAFSDLGNVLWAYDSIDALFKQRIISKNEEKLFRPNDSVTRAEFIKMLVCALGIEDKEAKAEFSDVSKSAWYYTYVASATEKGLITGDENGSFNPDGKISRQDICVILSRVMDRIGHPDEAYDEIFTDNDEISDYAKNAVYRLHSVNVISGMGDGTFAPKNDATRAQTAKMLMSFLKGVGV